MEKAKGKTSQAIAVARLEVQQVPLHDALRNAKQHWSAVPDATTRNRASARLPGRLLLDYCGLPCPLVDGLVAVSLDGAVRLLAEPGPAVVPVVPEPLGDITLPDGLVVAPPVAEPLPAR